MPIPGSAHRRSAWRQSRHWLCPALLACATAQASNDLTTLSLEQLLTVKITGASKYEQTAAEVAAAVSVITREDIRTFGWRTLEQALASLPGVHTTYDRQYIYLGMRGFGLPGDYNTRVLVTVNGNRLNDPLFDGGPYGRQLPLDLDLVERIEFIPGPGGAVYGQNAMFGVVNLVTRQGADVNGTELTASAQRPQSVREGRATWGRRLDNGIDLLLSVNAQRARGQDLSLDFGASGLSGIARGQDGERDREFFAQVAHGAWRAELMHGRWRKQDPTGAFLSDPLVPGQYQADRYTVAHWQYQEQLAEQRLDLLVRLFAGQEQYASTLVYTTPFEFPASSLWRGGEARLLWSGWVGHKLMLGVEAQQNTRIDQRSLDLADRGNDIVIRGKGHRVGVYLQDDWKIGPAFTAVLGLRVDRNDRTGTQASPRAALIWQAAAATTLKALLGRAHRAPNAYERDYDDGFAQIANPALRGETIDTTEVVADHGVGSDLWLRASAYRWAMRNIITLGLDEASGATQYQSGAKVGARGLELSADKTWRWGGRLRGSLSLQHVRAAGGTELLNSPQRMAKLSFSAPLPLAGLRLAYELLAESGRLTVDGSRLGGRALSNLNLSASGWAPGLELSLNLLNLFDKRYADPGADSNWQNAITQDGRSVRLEARYRF